MFCCQCGKEIPEDAQSCPNCQTSCRQMKGSQPPLTTADREDIKSGLIQAILVTLFCCLPFGIVAIIYAAKVSGLAEAGDIAGAQEAAKKSNMWSMVSFSVGLLGNIIIIALKVLAS